jgi:hypothetical protein
MNALVASVIRTLVPVIVGQVAAWLLLINVKLPADALDGLSSFLGAALTAIYYVGVRVLEQQWPQAGVLLGLTASPDAYSKSTANVTAPSADTSTPAVSTGPGPDVQSEDVTPAAVVQVKPQTVPDVEASTAAAVEAATAPYPTPSV